MWKPFSPFRADLTSAACTDPVAPLFDGLNPVACLRRTRSIDRNANVNAAPIGSVHMSAEHKRQVKHASLAAAAAATTSSQSATIKAMPSSVPADRFIQSKAAQDLAEADLVGAADDHPMPTTPIKDQHASHKDTSELIKPRPAGNHGHQATAVPSPDQVPEAPDAAAI